MTKVSDRVGCIWGTNENGDVEFLGYGTYVGDEVPIGSVGLFGEICQEQKILNPKIVLDSGKVVWGCECWWGKRKPNKKIS
ncbi:MAG: hypothetical protein AB1567_06885 [bacterium]